MKKVEAFIKQFHEFRNKGFNQHDKVLSKIKNK